MDQSGRKPWRLQSQLVMVISLCMISITLCTAWGTVWWTNRVATDYFIQDKQQFLEILSSPSKLALLFQSNELAKEALDLITLNDQVIHAWIVNADGTVLSQQGIEEIAKSGLPEFSLPGQKISQPNNKYIDIRKNLFSDNGKITQNETPVDDDVNSMDFEDPPQLIGRLIIRFSSEQLNKINDNVLFGILSISLLLTPLFIILGLWLSKRISKPLERLALQMLHWDRIDPVTLPEKESVLEINTLINSLKGLMIRLNTKTEELEYSYYRLVEETADKERMQAERNEFEHRLNQSQKMEAIGHLTSGIAHDFNNILGSIIGFSQLAQELVEDDESLERVNRYISEVRSAGERARDIVSQLLTLSRENKNEQHVFEVGSEIKQCVEFLRPMIPATITLNNRIPAKSNITIQFNKSEFSQAIMNLCINARDAIEQSGTIDLSLSMETFSGQRFCNSCHDSIHGDYICVCIRDTGCGIYEEHINSIFNPFFSTKEKDKGTGLGLSMVHGVIHRNGGHILMNSVVGEFTEFTILLKSCHQAVAETPRTDTVKEVARESSALCYNILIVDDDAQLLRFLTESLEHVGCTIKAFTDSTDALTELQHHHDKYDLLITDEIMPKLTGFEIIRTLYASDIKIPTIVCTGYTQHQHSDYHNFENVLQVLRKPLLKADIVKAIEGAISPSKPNIKQLPEAS